MRGRGEDAVGCEEEGVWILFGVESVRDYQITEGQIFTHAL